MTIRIQLFLLLCCLGRVCCMAEKGVLSKGTLKIYKNECKNLKEEGWKVYDKALSVDEALMQYYQQLEMGGDTVVHVIGTGLSRNVNTAYSKARSHASAQLASMRESQVAAQTTIRMSQSTADTEGGNTQFSTNIRTSAEQTMKALVPVVSLCRTVKDGKTEIRLYYIINN